MGLASALSTALTGLNAAETTIDVVGNNVANSNTVGFKASDAVFATQFLQTRSRGSSPTATSGGTNPRQIGLGTKVAEITPDFTQGTIEISSNPLDLAVQGDGFFIVQGSQGEQFYTRNGQFKTNSQNELTTITGQRVLGFGVEDFQIQRTELTGLTIPLGGEQVAQPTENVFLEGTLTPVGDIGDTPGIVQSAVLSDGSFEVPPNLDSTDIAVASPPNVATTALAPDAAAGAIAAGTYLYKVTFVDAQGNESPDSVEIGPITTTGTAGVDESILLSNIPAADGATFVDRNIYRTDQTGAGDFYLVGNVGDAATATFTDSADDATIIAAGTLNDDSLAPGNYGYYVTYYNTGNGVESRPTSLLGPQGITVDGRRIRLQNIPQPASGDFNAVRIYRNLSTDNSTFHLVSELGLGQTSFIDGTPDAVIEANDQINLDGPAISSGLALVDLVRRDGSTYENVFQEGVLSFSGRKGGRSLSAQELTITSTTTVQDMIEFMEQSLGIQTTSDDPNFPIPSGAGGSITTDSRLEFVSNMGTESAVNVGLSAFTLTTTGGVLESVSLPFSQTQEANGESAVTDFVVYDSLGTALNVRITAVLESTSSASTTYRWFADSSDNLPGSGVGISVGTGAITFDGNGNVISSSNKEVSIDRVGVSSASPLTFDLNFDSLSGLAADSSNIAASRQDGSGPGVLSSFIVTESGVIRGVFSNGATRDLGQIRMVRFANNAGLEQIGENLYSASVNSGLPVDGDPGEQGIGTISAGAVELSNTDIGQNLIELILASTQYRGGTRVITAVQQLLDELLNLRR